MTIPIGLDYLSPLANEISERVKNFIYLYVDSIELLEILLRFQKDREKSWDAPSLAGEFRSHTSSIQNRILFLQSVGLLSEDANAKQRYQYNPANQELDEIISELAEIYRVRRHTVFELIFSPMKKARDFANAFRLGKGPKGGTDNG